MRSRARLIRALAPKSRLPPGGSTGDECVAQHAGDVAGGLQRQPVGVASGGDEGLRIKLPMPYLLDLSKLDRKPS